MTKGIVSWANPVFNTDGSAFDPTTIGGYELSFDGAAAVSILPAAGESTSFDMNSLAAYTALKGGNHTVAVDVVTKTGEKSAFSAAAPFHIPLVPLAPTAVVVS